MEVKEEVLFGAILRDGQEETAVAVAEHQGTIQLMVKEQV